MEGYCTFHVLWVTFSLKISIVEEEQNLSYNYSAHLSSKSEPLLHLVATHPLFQSCGNLLPLLFPWAKNFTHIALYNSSAVHAAGLLVGYFVCPGLKSAEKQ